jgi:integrase
MRVPARYSSIEKRSELHRSLKTGDRKEADARLAVVERQILAELDEKLAGRKIGSRSHFEAIAELSVSRGFGYKTAEELADGDLSDLMQRIAYLKAKDDKPGSAHSVSMLGGIERPKLTISEVAASMSERFPLEVKNKTPRQKKTWENRWKRPVKKIVAIAGHDPIFGDVTRRTAVALRDELQDRVVEGTMNGGSAQKEFQLLNAMWDRFHKSLGIDAEDVPRSPFRGLGDGMARNDDEKRKLEVPIDWIRDKILAQGAMKDVDPAIRDIVFTIIETGCRQSEITDASPALIKLNEPIPYLEISMVSDKEFAREIKNKQSKRKVPLVGVALDAMRRNPDGFPKYRGTGTFSGEANAALRKVGLLPDGVTIGGLRHSFETRMSNAGVRMDDAGEMMGHSVKRIRGREHYGDEMPLEEKKTINELIMFKAAYALPSS